MVVVSHGVEVSVGVVVGEVVGGVEVDEVVVVGGVLTSL